MLIIRVFRWSGWVEIRDIKMGWVEIRDIKIGWDRN